MLVCSWNLLLSDSSEAWQSVVPLNLVNTDCVLANHHLREPMSEVFHERLYVGILKQAGSAMSHSCRKSLGHLRFELLYNEFNGHVLEAVELFLGITGYELKTPLADIYHFVPQISELDMTVILPQVIDRLLGENSFHEVVAVTHKNVWNILCNEKSH